MSEHDDARGLVKRLVPRSTVGRVAVPTTTVAVASFAALPAAHIANALALDARSLVGPVTLESVGIGAGAGLAVVGAAFAGRGFADDNTKLLTASFTAASVGCVASAFALSEALHNVQAINIVMPGLIGGVLATVAGIPESKLPSSETTLRNVAIASGSVGSGLVIADMVHALGVPGLPDPAVLGHVGAGALAATIPVVAVAWRAHRREHPRVATLAE